MNKKYSKIILGTAMLAVVAIVPFSNVLAAEVAPAKTAETVEAKTEAVVTAADVTTEAEFKAALANSAITTINLKGDIEVTEKINISNKPNLTINGNNKTMKMTMQDNTKWESTKAYVLQAYKSVVTIQNIKLTGANAGLLVNGSTVTLDGKIDVSGNGFGGIELSQGKDVTEQVVLNTNNATIENTTETFAVPTLWLDKAGEDVKVEYQGFNGSNSNEKKDVNNQKYSQTRYYIIADNAIMPVEDQIKNLIDTDTKATIIMPTNGEISVALLKKLKTGTAREMVLKFGDIFMSFNTKNIDPNPTKPLSISVEASKDLKVSDALKAVAKADANPIFLNLKYEGELPKGAVISFSVKDQYAKDKEVYLYYFNEKTAKAELISNDVKIDKDEMANITVENAGTYFLAGKELVAEVPDKKVPVTPNEKAPNVKNPNTSDFSAVIISTLAIIGAGGIAFISKKSRKQN